MPVSIYSPTVASVRPEPGPDRQISDTLSSSWSRPYQTRVFCLSYFPDERRHLDLVRQTLMPYHPRQRLSALADSFGSTTIVAGLIHFRLSEAVSFRFATSCVLYRR